jgi:predicted ArsR family transcriptional regulator
MRNRNNFVRESVLEELKTKPIGVLMAVPESLADDLGVSRRAVEMTLSHLETEGQITWTRKTRGGIRRPFYLVTVLKAVTQ